jgi:hypothetical protein
MNGFSAQPLYFPLQLNCSCAVLGFCAAGLCACSWCLLLLLLLLLLAVDRLGSGQQPAGENTQHAPHMLGFAWPVQPSVLLDHILIIASELAIKQQASLSCRNASCICVMMLLPADGLPAMELG